MNNNLISINGKIKCGKDEVTTIIQYLTSKTYKNGLSYDYFKILNEELKKTKTPFTNVKFADVLKEIVCLIIGCTREQLEDQEFKNTPLGPQWDVFKIITNSNMEFDGGSTLLTDAIFKTKEEAETFIKENDIINITSIERTPLTPRKMLQLIGTEGGRYLIHPDIWVNALFSKYNEKSKWIISDLRFQNEMDRVNLHGGVTIKIKRKMSLRFPKLWEIFITTNYRNQTWSEEAFLVWLEGYDFELYETLTHSSETELENNNINFSFIIENNGDLNNLIEEIKKILKKLNIT